MTTNNCIAGSPPIQAGDYPSDICLPGYPASIHPPHSYTLPQKIQTIHGNGHADTNPKDCDVDHLKDLDDSSTTRDIQILQAEELGWV